MSKKADVNTAIKVIHWQNGMVMSFNEAGQQIPELQGGPHSSDAFEVWLREQREAGRVSPTAEVTRGAVWRPSP